MPAAESHHPEALDPAPPAPVPGTLPELFTAAAEAFAPRAALAYRGAAVTYGELAAEAERFAAGLARAGAGGDAPVALLMPNTPAQPAAFFGAALAGTRIVQLSPLDAPRQLAHKLADSGARLMVTTDAEDLLARGMTMLADGAVDRLVVAADGAPWPSRVAPALSDAMPGTVAWPDFVADPVPPAARPRPAPGDVALIQYTGGTTGAPKGAMLTHANLTAAVASYDAWFGAQGLVRRGADRVICVLPLSHIYGLTVILLRHVFNGSEIRLHRRFDAERVLDDIEASRASFFPGVPAMWTALLDQPDIGSRDLSSLVYAGSGGAPLPRDLERRVEKLIGQRLQGGWGMTETGPAGSGRPRSGPDKPGSVGVALPGVSLEIVAADDPRRVLGPGEIGELRVRGANVCAGYWGRPDETRAAFVDGWFLTGDIGYLDADGYLFLVDRKKDMIVSGGFNVYPQMIEQAIHAHPEVREVAVVGVPDAYRGEAAMAFVVLRPGAAGFTLEGLRAFLADRLGRHELPAGLEFRDSLPRTPVGKIAKTVLRADARAGGRRTA